LRPAAGPHAEHDGDAEQRATSLAGVGVVFVDFRLVGLEIKGFFKPDQYTAECTFATDHPDPALLIPCQPIAKWIGREPGAIVMEARPTIETTTLANMRRVFILR
jgi:hypothetical protein